MKGAIETTVAGDAHSGKRRQKKKAPTSGLEQGSWAQKKEELEDTDGKRLRAIPEGPALRVCDHGGFGRYVGGGIPDSWSIGQDIPSLPIVELEPVRTNPAIYHGREL